MHEQILTYIRVPIMEKIGMDSDRNYSIISYEEISIMCRFLGKTK